MDSQKINAASGTDKRGAKCESSTRKGYNASTFETLAVQEHMTTDAETQAAIPSEAAVEMAKQWVDENEL